MGKNCEFLHEYNLRKFPECWWFGTYGFCAVGDECLYYHPKERKKECEDFNRGFCRLGELIRSRIALPCENLLKWNKTDSDNLNCVPMPSFFILCSIDIRSISSQAQIAHANTSAAFSVNRTSRGSAQTVPTAKKDTQNHFYLHRLPTIHHHHRYPRISDLRHQVTGGTTTTIR